MRKTGASSMRQPTDGLTQSWPFLSHKYAICYQKEMYRSTILRWYNLNTIDLVHGKALTPSDYKSLADMRHHIRRFLHFSELAVRGLGLEPRQHQLMLALKGLPRGTRPRIGELAERLQIRHHSTVELVNRLAIRGYVQRQKGENDRREVLLTLHSQGRKSAARTIATPPGRTAQGGSRIARSSPASDEFDQEHEWAGRRPA